jgi:imidazolonepropionase-like amidohydrolase
MPPEVEQRLRAAGACVSGTANAGATTRFAPYLRMIGDIANAGGRVVAGTDSPILPYGLSLQTELEHLVAAGLPPHRALRTATVDAAAAIGMAGKLGVVAPGALADLVVVDGNPLEDIRDARRVRETIKDGVVYRADDLVRGPARAH